MAKIGLDFTHPIMHNRNEIIAVKFSGCIKNACEMLLTGVLNSKTGVWYAKYPGLERIKHFQSPKEEFYNLMYFTPKSFLEKSRSPREPLPELDVAKDLSILMGKLSNPSLCSMTSLEIGLHEIAKYDWCKRIIIYDTALNDNVKQYIAKIYGEFASKIYFYEGFLKELLLKYPDVTTYFVDDAEELMTLMEYYEVMKRKDLFNEKQFFVQGLTAIVGKKEDGKPEYKYEGYMKDAIARFNANVMWMTSHYVDLNDDHPTADLKFPETNNQN